MMSDEPSSSCRVQGTVYKQSAFLKMNKKKWRTSLKTEASGAL